MKHLGAGRTAIFMNLIPVITAVVAALFLDEALHVYHLIGGGMTLRDHSCSEKTKRKKAMNGRWMSECDPPFHLPPMQQAYDMPQFRLDAAEI